MFIVKSSLLVSVLLLLPGWATDSAAVAGATEAYHPTIVPANFQAKVDNPFFPLVPGTASKFVEGSGDDASENEVTVTHDTKVIMGVTCVVVHDVEKEHGVLSEDTFDWYAQDKQGNVWCFGEDTREFHNGKADTGGSWQAGADGAQPGIIMPGQPAPGKPYREEYSPGKAEDMGQVIAVSDSVAVAFGTFHGCVTIKEWSPLESGSEKKWYAKGVGVVKELSESGEITELVSVNQSK